MTEYIILVGAIAVLLVGAIKRFGLQLDVTVQGTEKALDKEVTNPMNQPPGGNNNNNGGGANAKPATGTAPDTQVNDTTGRTTTPNGTTYTATRARNADGTFGPWVWQ